MYILLHTLLMGMNISFVHIPKTGGSAIEYWIRKQHAGIKPFVRNTCNTSRWDSINQRYFGAASRKHCISNYAQTPKDWVRFCVIRNPIDRAVSTWKYRSCQGDANRYIQTMLRYGELDNHDMPQHDFAIHCNIRLCFENLVKDFSDFVNIYISHLKEWKLRPINTNRCRRNLTLTRATLKQIRSKYALDFPLWYNTCSKQGLKFEVPVQSSLHLSAVISPPQNKL